MQRVSIPELLDTDSGTPAEVAGSLCDLRWFNRWFGGIRTSRSLVEQVARNTKAKRITLLEVAAGAGYVPNAVRSNLADQGLDLEITVLDRARSHLNGTPRAVAADALSLPFADNSFDIVSSCLFVHHLSPPEVTRFAVEGLRVARTAFVINDLIRSPIHLGIAYAGLPLYRSRLTRHDAPASVRQAYTSEEMYSLLAQVGAARIEIERHYLYRMGVIVWKR